MMDRDLGAETRAVGNTNYDSGTGMVYQFGKKIRSLRTIMLTGVQMPYMIKRAQNIRESLQEESSTAMMKITSSDIADRSNMRMLIR